MATPPPARRQVADISADTRRITTPVSGFGAQIPVRSMGADTIRHMQVTALQAAMVVPHAVDSVTVATRRGVD